MGANRSQMFTAALAHYRAGEPVEADAACASLLAHWPEDVDALNLRAVLACMAERYTEATTLLEQVLTRHPDNLQALSTLADALYVQGNMAGAVTAFERTVGLAPLDAKLRSRLGTALLDLGRPTEAETAYRQSIALADHVAQSHFNLGVALGSLDRTPEAVAAYRMAIALDPHHVAAHLNLGNALMDQNELAEAIAVYAKTLAFAPTDARIHCNLSVALLRLDQVDDAIEACRTAIAHDPLYASAHTNLGVALQRLDRLDEAIAAHEKAIALDPEFAKAYSNLAECLRDEGRLDESLRLNRQAVALDSCEDLHRFNHALALLMEGDYEAGWPAYEVRRKAGVLGPSERSLPPPEWRGEPLQGRTLLLHAEQGLGDTLQFVRYVRELNEPGVSIVIESQRPLTGLLQSLGPVRVVTQGESLPPFDFHLPLMSLPNVLRTRLDSIPAAIPYLAADPTKIARWKARIGQTRDLAVGVVWSGNPNHKSDRRRSIAAAAVLPDLVMPGVRLFSLQKDPRAEDANILQALAAVVTDLAPSLDDFSDTAAALEALDLIIAVDTSTAHLAGALGRPVWMMLPFALDWRWLRDREDSPWYPTMRLFRQSTPRVWTDVIGRIRSELSRLAQEGRDRPARLGTPPAASPSESERRPPQRRRG
jgi:tetratricopeptide (TPR) repeat protein